MKNFSPDSLKKMFAYGDKIHPERDWFVLLAVSAVLLLASMAWNVYLFTQLEDGKTIGGSAPAFVQKPTGATITEVQNIFKSRATEEGNYQNVYHFVDPSVPSS